MLSLNWEKLPEDVDYWNTDISQKINWTVQLEYRNTSKDKSNFVKLQYDASNYDVAVFPELFVHIIGATILSQNIKYFTAKSETICFILPSDQVPFVGDDWKVSNETHSHTDISLHIHFPRFQWRGIEKYLYIVVIASNENVDDLADDFIRNDILPKTQSKQYGTYHIETNHSYWIRVFRRYHFLNNEIETTVANKSLPCANENVTYISNHLLDIEVISASLTYLHPYTPYKIYTSVCNENGCNKKSFESFTTTKPYIPAAAPQNTSIEPADNFGILLRWRPVDRFYVNNEIKEVTIRYLITRTNKTREFRHDYDKNYYIEENIGKYELVCFQIAAFTDLGIGPYSNMSCNYTHQSAPDVAPDFQIITANSSSFTIEIYKPIDISLINGILTSVIVTYNISWNEYTNKSYEIDHEAFIDFNVSLFLVLGNLKPFTSYFLSLAFATIDVGLFSSTVLNKTRIDNPSYPPSNITLLYNESYLNTKWNNLPSYQWNGPALEYNITLLETLLDGTISMKFFRVVYPQNYLLIFNLHPYRNHMLNITSCTIVGCSYPHSSVFQTLEYVPCPPNNVSRIESIRNKLCVQWSQIDAECENGILKSYNIFVKQITKQPYAIEKSFSYNVSSSHLKSCVEDIPMGRIYNISVAGSTGAGLGPRSAVLSLVFGVIVNGNWTLWTKWTPCTSSCDNGTRSRQRFCSNPTPVNGLPCQGHNNETKYCILPRCEGEYLAPQGKFDCQTFCEDLGLKCRGYISTKNSTDIFIKLGKTCSSLTEKFKHYEEDFHPSYDNEHNVCAGFVMKNGMVKCKVVNNGAHNHVQRICNCQDPESEGLSEWYSWSPCLDKCNASLTKTRSRSCMPGFQCSKKAKLIDQQTCGLPPCPIDGGWSEWQESTRCSKSCDGGYKVKVRTCTNPPPDHGGDKCPGPSEDEGEVCNAHPCPVDGGWSLWTEWSSCNQPCGTTNQRRERFCNSPKPKYRGADCSSDRQVAKRQTFCDFPVCIELDVSLTLRISNRDWHFTMYQLTSPLAKSLEKDVYENILENRSEITSVKLTKLSRGSVIPTIMLRYNYVNQVQITSLVNQIDRTKMIGDLQIDDYQVYVTLVPYHPPVDISVGIINKTSVNISWRLIDEKFKGKFIYVMYIEKDHSKDVEWNIEGVESSRNFILLYYLKPGQLYEAYLVQSNHFGNGIPSGRFLIQTLISPPSKYPLNVRGYALSSTGIYLSWNPIPEDIQNVQLSGYIVKYKKHNEKHFKSKEIDKNLLSSTLTGLEPYTYYEVDVSGINEGGEGPADYAMIKTLEGVPSVPVPVVKVVDMQTIDWWSVSWSPLPKNKIHGILRGYRLKYYMSYRSDIPIGGEINWIVNDFDKFTFYHKEKNLLNYATYNLTVTGFTNAGEGPTPEHFAKTCRCKRHLFGQWTILNPYTERSTNSANLTGLFPNLILKAMIKACGSCAKYHQSVLDLYSTKYGSNPMKHSDYELKLNINEDVDVSFPYYERITTHAIVPESIFLPIIKSTGCAFITRDEINLNQLVIDLILNVFKVWPLLIVGYAIAALCGVLIWATDQFMNPDEFKIGSSLRGPCIGFWFSFVTMTTVGYGDLTPRSIAARVLSMLWFLIGLILNGIIVGFITTALTSLDQPETVKLYNTKTAALSKSYEYRFAVRRNANVQDKQYTTIDEMLDDLEDKKVDAVLVDLFSMVGYKEKIKSRYLKVKTILDTQTAYGIILSGQSVHLKNDIETMIFSEQGSLSNFIRSIEDDIPKLSESKLGDVMPLVFGADSATFKETALIMVYILACLIFVGFVFEMIRIMRRRIKVDVAGDEILMKIEHDVELFVNTVTSRLENMVHTQERERIYLNNLIQAVKRYESKVGKVAASIKIEHLWDD